jgi:hypothetical protein
VIVLIASGLHKSTAQLVEKHLLTGFNVDSGRVGNPFLDDLPVGFI